MARIGIIVSAELPPEFTIPKWKEYVLASVKSGLSWRHSDVGASVTVTGTIVNHAPPGEGEPF